MNLLTGTILCHLKIGLQKDGKAYFWHILHNSSSSSICIKRFTSNGFADSSFGINGTATCEHDSRSGADYGFCMTIDSKDRIIYGITVDEYTKNRPQTDFSIQRLTKDGVFDSSFGDNGSVIIDCTNNPLFTYHQENIQCIAVDEKDNIFVTGDYEPSGTKWGGDYFCIPLAKIKDNGSFDSSFGTNGKALIPLIKLKMYPDHMVLQPDGKIVIGSYLMRQSSIKPFNWGLYRFC